MIPSWYPLKDAKDYFAGIFHYETAMDLKKYCDIAMYFPFDSSLKTENSEEVERGILTYRSKFIRDQRIRNRIRIWREFKRIVKEYHPNIIHVHVAVEAGKYAVFLGKIYHIPVVITEHSATENAISGKLGYYISKYVYSRCAFIACCSTNLQHNLQQFFPKLKFDVVYNGIQPVNIMSSDVKQYRRDNCINIAIVAGFYAIDNKGYQFLLPAIKQVIDERKHTVTLHIIGDGEYKSYYENMAQDFNISDFCIFYGGCPREKVYEIVSQMDFFVSASLVECSSVSVQEAMLLGQPILVTRSGGANSLVTERTAIVVDRGSSEALAKGIDEMIERLEQFNRDDIRAYAEQNFEISHISEQYMDIYQNILKNKKRKTTERENES